VSFGESTADSAAAYRLPGRLAKVTQEGRSRPRQAFGPGEAASGPLRANVGPQTTPLRWVKRLREGNGISIPVIEYKNQPPAGGGCWTRSCLRRPEQNSAGISRPERCRHGFGQ